VPQVTNALKFSNNSPVSVRVALEPKAQDEEEESPTMRTLRVDVADQGVGVAPEDQERVFKKYERAAPEAGGGAGLGLHLCRSFARAMDGDVSLASELGRGATFTLRVPVRVLAHDEAPPPSGDAAAAACKPAAQAPDLFGRVLANQAAGRLPAVDPFAEVLLEEMVQHYLREAREVFAFSAPLSGEQDSTTPVVAYVSPSVRTVLGWEPEQLMGSTGVPLLHPDDVDKHAGSAAALWAAEGRFVYGMRRVRRANGSYLWMHMEMYRAPDAGNVHYILWRDATSFKESQSSLKEYLLATSHDMRTPVTGIVTAAQLLEARPCVRADAEAAFLVQSIKSCGGLMDSVISNVMQLRSLDDLDDVEAVCAARDVLQPVPFDPRVLVDDVLLATCTALGHDCRHLGISQPAALPACVVADRERLQRTVQNLLICLLRHSTDDRQLSIRLACERSSGAAGLDAAVASAADETAELQLGSERRRARRGARGIRAHVRALLQLQDAGRGRLAQRAGAVRGARVCARDGRLACRGARGAARRHAQWHRHPPAAAGACAGWWRGDREAAEARRAGRKHTQSALQQHADSTARSQRGAGGARPEAHPAR
jgi:PAS domain S-box-containing protein